MTVVIITLVNVYQVVTLKINSGRVCLLLCTGDRKFPIVHIFLDQIFPWHWFQYSAMYQHRHRLHAQILYVPLISKVPSQCKFLINICKRGGGGGILCYIYEGNRMLDILLEDRNWCKKKKGVSEVIMCSATLNKCSTLDCFSMIYY